MNRVEKLQKLLNENGLDAMLLVNPKNRRWCTGLNSSDGTVLVTRHELFCFADSRYIEIARETVKNATVGLTSLDMPLKAWLTQAISDCGVRRLGFEEDYLSYAAHRRFADMLDAELLPAGKIMTELRAAKDEEEKQAIVRAQAITDAVFMEILDFIRPGVSENDIAAEISYRQLKKGAEGNSFDPIVVAGKKSSMPHGEPGNNKIAPGDFITMDFGCLVDGYCSDMTRTVAVDSATDEMRHIYDIVLQAQAAGIAAARAGITGREIDKAGRSIIEQAGYGEYFGHSFGHSLGLDIHESPSASPTETRVMPAGAVISAEPGIYIPGKFGVRIEDILYLDENGCTDLTKSPKNLIIL
ncbi:MAG: M24 family metallopeptidase [Candidatus Heteroscillospira sp.]|jgi:Xaa-Pro aminopeptidase